MLNKILIVGPAWVGDMVIAQSLFKLLKQRQPHTIIDVLAPDWNRPLLQRMPEVRQAWIAPFKHGELKLQARFALGRQLSAEHYQQAIVLPHSFKSALVPWFANIPRRTGWCGELRWGLLNDIRYKPNVLPLLVQRFAALALSPEDLLPTVLPPPSLCVSSTNITQVLQRLSLTPSLSPILALCPGAEYGIAKRWPAEHYAAIAQHYAKQGWDIWLFGSERDQTITAQIQKLSQHLCNDLAGKTTLGEAVDLLSLATAVVCNDSGLMHIAAALQKPLVAIYGSSSPNFTPPLTTQAKIVSLQLACSPCFQRTCPLGHTRCLQDLSPQLVLQAMQTLLIN
ncbi:MAG: lipopolysaccharide heptosyltransferase II [Gammaproteobacteria bacterium]